MIQVIWLIPMDQNIINLVLELGEKVCPRAISVCIFLAKDNSVRVNPLWLLKIILEAAISVTPEDVSEVTF